MEAILAEIRAGRPAGHGTVTAVIYLQNAAAALDYYRLAFGAVELKRVPGVYGTIAHAEMRIGDTVVVVVDQLAGSGGGRAGTGAVSPRVELALYSEDADAVYERAIELGATVTLPIGDVFWGDRYGKVMDPFGQVWALGTRKELLTVDQVVERARANTLRPEPAP
jgi:uncharacterized glyoxalase superfamily protein PhnB